MMKAVCLAFALVALAAPARAQMAWTDQGFANVSFGVQAGSRTLTSSSTFDLYGEQGSLDTSQDIGGGALFDLSAGYKVWRNLAVGAGYSRIKNDGDAALAASVPDPDLTDRPRSVSGTAAGLNHSEDVFYFTGTWMIPVTDVLDVGLSFGPAIFQVTQDMPTAITVTEPSAAISNTSIAQIKKTTAGFAMAVDVNYFFNKRFGAGGLMRYTFGSADIEGAADSLTVGGFHIGVGLRMRF